MSRFNTRVAPCVLVLVVLAVMANGEETGGSRDDRCSLPSATGMCRAMMPSYFFNTETGACELFIYGGCGGNRNRFFLASACVEACGGPMPSPGSGIIIEPPSMMFKIDDEE